MRKIVLFVTLVAVMYTANRIPDQTASWALAIGGGLLVMTVFLLYDHKYPKERQP